MAARFGCGMYGLCSAASSSPFVTRPPASAVPPACPPHPHRAASEVRRSAGVGSAFPTRRPCDCCRHVRRQVRLRQMTLSPPGLPRSRQRWGRRSHRRRQRREATMRRLAEAAAVAAVGRTSSCGGSARTRGIGEPRPQRHRRSRKRLRRLRRGGRSPWPAPHPARTERCEQPQG